ncbi:MAG: ClpXP protease specificity-enhancing factor SspB [Hyphomicrobiaceae bacterium]
MAGGGRIDYEQLTQDAMRSIVRTVLSRTAKAGLPGEHHFYISFDTRARGVVLSRRLKEKYPEEMTVVLQHRFSDLIVSDDRFEVKLTFDNIPERLVVPFLAIKVFFDPSVHFGLQFDTMDNVVDADGTLADTSGTRPASGASRLPGPGSQRSRAAASRKPRAPRRPSAEPEDAIAGAENDESGRAAPPTPAPAASDSGRVEDGAAADDAPPRKGPAQPGGGAEIVRLDQFRKK